MSAEKTCEENTARNDNEPVFPHAVPFWMRVTVEREDSTLSEEAGRAAADGPEDSGEGAAESDETFAVLLRAIEGTEIARLLGGMAPPTGNREAQGPAPDEPTSPRFKPPILSSPPDLAAEAEPAAAAPHPSAGNELAKSEEAGVDPLKESENAEATPGVEAVADRGLAQEPLPAEAAEIAEAGAAVEVPDASLSPATEAEPAVVATPSASELDETQVNEELRAALLRAIQGTEIAKRLQAEAQGDEGAAEAASPAELMEPAAASIEVEAPIAFAAVAAKMEAEPAAVATPNPSAVDETAASLEEPAATEEVAEEPVAAEEPKAKVGDEAELPVASPPAAEPAKPTHDSRRSPAPNRRALVVKSRRPGRGRRGGKGRYANSRGRTVFAAAAAPIQTADQSAETAPPRQLVEPEPPTAAPLTLVETPTAEPAPQDPTAEPEPLTAAAPLTLFNVPITEPVPQYPPAEPESTTAALPIRIFEAPTPPEAPSPASAEAAIETEPVEPVKTTETNRVPEVHPRLEPGEAGFAPKTDRADSPSRVLTPAKNGSSKNPKRAKLGAGINRVSLRQTGDYLDRAETHLESWFLRWFDPPDPRRRSSRVAAPPLIAYHWSMDMPQGLKIGDISSSGMYLLTPERWTEGVIVSLTLQRTDMDKGLPESWIAVDFVVTRWGQDGIGGEFIPWRPGLTDAVAGRANNCADKKTLERFVAQLTAPAEQ